MRKKQKNVKVKEKERMRAEERGMSKQEQNLIPKKKAPDQEEETREDGEEV